MEKRIAILSYRDINGNDGYVRSILNITKILKEDKDTKVMLFFISDKDTKGKVWGNEAIGIKGYRYPDRGSGLSRLFDFLFLYASGFRPSIYFINKNSRYLEQVKEFNPTHIVLSFNPIFFDLLKEYKRISPQTIIVNNTDSPKIIENSFLESELYLKNNFIFRIMSKRLKRKYLEYMLDNYKKTLVLSDIIITSTKEDRAGIYNMIKNQKPKIFILPLIFDFDYISKNTAKAKTKSKFSNKIAFIGNYFYYPNRESIEVIQKIIAPKLPDKQFLIIGNGCPIKKVNNVTYLGGVKDVQDTIKDVDICIAPTLHGSGMKTKLIDYFIARKPVVATRIALSGYDYKNYFNCIEENDINKFHLRIEELYKNRKLLDKIGQNGISNINLKYSTVDEKLRDIFNSTM